jgi:hypothetical protein
VVTKDCDDFTTCRKTLEMTFGSMEILATGGDIKVGTQQLGEEESYLENALIIERRGEYIYLKFSDGVRIKWSVDSLSVFLTVEDRYMEKVSGLCGDYNGETHEKEFLLPDQTYTSEVSRFGNAWRMDSSVSCSKIF